MPISPKPLSHCCRWNGIGLVPTIFSLFLASCIAPSVGRAESYLLTEPVSDARVFTVTNKLTVNGHLKTPGEDGTVSKLPLKVTAKINYLERRLSGTGRDARALRSLRHYTHAEAKIEVREQITTARLPEEHRWIVAQGQQAGIVIYHPDFHLTSGEIELLKLPGDSLAILSLLPQTAVEIGETWTPSDWAVQMLTETEAVEKSDFLCKLTSVQSETARVEFKGTLQGASLGSKTSIHITGHYLYDLKRRHITKLELTQTEKRPVQGAVTPGMDLVAKTEWERTPADNPHPLTDAASARIPLNPPKKLLHLSFRTAWNVHFKYDRNWHLFHQTDRAVVLRLLDEGSLIAQCNLSALATFAPGKHLSKDRFEKYIRDALGTRLNKIESAGTIDFDQAEKPFVYRVVAVGKSDSRPMHWIYYLWADKSGRQTALVFSVESQLIKRLNNRDLQIVRTLKFVSLNVKPISSSP